jgi:hypothetical protein
LDVGGGHDDGEQQSEGIDEDVPFTAFDLLMRIKAVDPPCSVVFTD